jgi:hypothetical protein
VTKTAITEREREKERDDNDNESERVTKTARRGSEP